MAVWNAVLPRGRRVGLLGVQPWSVRPFSVWSVPAAVRAIVTVSVIEGKGGRKGA